MLYILFYSNYCIHSKKIINFLEKSGEITYFAKICVDKSVQTGKRHALVKNYGITEVPTIVVENKILPGILAFKWLSNKIESAQHSTPTMATRANKQSVSMKQVQEPQRQALEPFMMGASASSLSNLTDNCVLLDNSNNRGIYTPSADEDIQKTNGLFVLQDDNITGPSLHPENNGRADDSRFPSISVKKDSLKSKQMESEYNRLLEERDSSVPRPVSRV